MHLQFQFLGTAAGMPTRERNVTALAIQACNQQKWVLFDCGEGTQHQLLRSGFNLQLLDTICITHRHGDHIFGLPGLLATCSMLGRKHPLKVIGPKVLQDLIPAILKGSDSGLTYEIEFFDVAEVGKMVQADLVLEPLELSHRVPCFGYQVSHSFQMRKLKVESLQALGVPKGPIWGQLLRAAHPIVWQGCFLDPKDFIAEQFLQTSLFVGGDNDQPERLGAITQPLNLIIHEATYTQAVANKVGRMPMHSSARQVAEVAETLKIPNLILTHISSRYPGKKVLALQQEAQAFYSGSLWIAQDFDIFQLKGSRCFSSRI